MRLINSWSHSGSSSWSLRLAGGSQNLAVELEGVAAAGGADQYGVEGFGAGGLAFPHHGLEAGQQRRGQGAGLLQFALVVGDGAAAALGRWDHQLNAIGAEYPHGRGIHGRIKQALHAAEHQAHPVTPRALGRHQRRPGILEGLAGEGWQQPLHRL